MGLCKCPKRKVTIQFCFEHRVNVCEYCVVLSHPNCVVQSYLLWLKDSSYAPDCSLCKSRLTREVCARLTCYHIFHWRCLKSHVTGRERSSVPGSYSCPECDGPIVPETNDASPVADALRAKLSTEDWSGICLPCNADQGNLPNTPSRPLNSLLNTFWYQEQSDLQDLVPDGILGYPGARTYLQKKYNHLIEMEDPKYRPKIKYHWSNLFRRHYRAHVTGPKTLCKTVILAFALFTVLTLLYVWSGEMVNE